MSEKLYEVYMYTPMGKKSGRLLIQQEGKCLSGWLDILMHKEPIAGTIDEEGNCQIKGVFITLLNSVHFTATGRITDSLIDLTMEDEENRHFQMSGNSSNKIFFEREKGNYDKGMD